MPVGFHDAAYVGLYHGALQRTARLGLDDGCKFLVLYFLVAFECDVVEHRRLGQMHDKPFTDAIDGNFVEQTCRQQRLECRIARGVIVSPVGGRMEIRTYGVGVDAAISLHLDDIARLRNGLGR